MNYNSAVAKTNDPSTSWDAGETFHAGRARAIHFNMILGAMTADAQTSAELTRGCALDRHQVARRLPEMERENLVERDGYRLCRVTGRRSVIWKFKEAGHDR